LHNSIGRFFLRFGNFPPQICESYGAIYRQNYETFTALYRTSYPLTETTSKSTSIVIIGDAIRPKITRKLTKTCGSELGGLLWRHLTPQRKTAIWAHNYSPSGAQRPKDFRKFYFLYDFWCAQSLFVPSRYWTTYTNFYKLLLSPLGLYSDMRKKILYRCTSAFSALNYCGRIFFKSLSYLYDVGSTNFSAEFWTFRNF